MNLKYKVGFWTAIAGLVLGIGYMLAIAAIFISGTGFPPVEPYQTLVSIISLITAPVMVILWSTLHRCVPENYKIFSQGSLSLVIIFAALTGINRYVSMTVVPQALAAGKTAGLEWFMPYGWPSVMAAIEVEAWGFFLGLAFLCLAPVFSKGKLEKALFWTLIVSGGLCLVATVGQIINSIPLNMAGILGWGVGLCVAMGLMAAWFRRSPA